MDVPNHPRIVLDPAICHGKPTIRGTRVPVFVLAGAVGAGDSVSVVAADYSVTETDVQAAIAYVNHVAQSEITRPLRAKAS